MSACFKQYHETVSLQDSGSHNEFVRAVSPDACFVCCKLITIRGGFFLGTINIARGTS